MILLMPIGGTGQRFRQAGYTLPKPLIPYQGKPLIHWALQSYAELPGTWIFLLRPEALMAGIEQYLPSTGQIEVISQETRGPVETIVSANLTLDDELLIADCDSLIEPWEIKQAIRHFRLWNADGGVTVRQTTEPYCSYAKLDQQGWVQETRERDPFSPWSTTGPYWWKSGRRFLSLAEQALSQSIVSVSPVYNLLLHQGGQVKALAVSTFQHLGTPEALHVSRFVDCRTSF